MAGINFIGPVTQTLRALGDKTVARGIAQKANVPVLPGGEAVRSREEAHELAKSLGYPVIVKAAMGGGGRGMRVAQTAEKLDEALEQAGREAGNAFGIEISQTEDALLERNVASGNDGDGIRIGFDATGVRLDRNRTDANADNGLVVEEPGNLTGQILRSQLLVRPGQRPHR